MAYLDIAHAGFATCESALPFWKRAINHIALTRSRQARREIARHHLAFGVEAIREAGVTRLGLSDADALPFTR